MIDWIDGNEKVIKASRQMFEKLLRSGHPSVDLEVAEDGTYSGGVKGVPVFITEFVDADIMCIINITDKHCKIYSNEDVK